MTPRIRSRARTRVRALRRATSRSGFALPLAILVIAALTATLTAAFSSVTAEIATNSAQRSESRAFVLAESGMEDYIARRQYHCTARAGYVAGVNFTCGTPPTVAAESVTVTLPGGYAIVTLTRARVAFGARRPATYLVKSRGVDTLTPFNGATRTAYGERIVALYVTWNTQSIQVFSSITSLAGISKTGASGIITGVDNCSAANGGTGASVAGISAPTGTISVSGAVVAGTPAQQPLGTQAAADSAVHIDWFGLVTGTAVTADYTFAYNAPVPAALLADFTAVPAKYPVIHVTGMGDWNLPSGGRGLLILDGNPYMGHGGWDGVMLAGGTIRGNGTDYVYGAMVTGLNNKLTAAQLAATGLTAPTTGDDLRGVKDYYFDSCSVAKASAGLGFFAVMPNAWMDNFTTY